MKRGTAAKVILGKDALMDVPAGIVHGTDVILGGKAGLLNDFGGLVLSNNLMIGKKVSRGTITTITVRGQSPLVLPDAISGSLQAVKAFGGTEQNGTPTPDAPVDIVSNNGVLKFGVLSTNLLDLANCTDGYCYTPAGEYTATPNARLSNYIPVKAGVTYTVGLTGEEGHSNVRINLFDTAKNWLSQTVFISYAGEKCTQSITPTQDGFLAFSANYLSSSRVDWNTAQVVQGSYTTETMPEYEPYRTGIYTDGTVETIVANSKNYLTRDGETTGQIINADGTVSNNSSYNISAPFTLPAGDYTCTWTINAGNRPFSVFKCDANGNIILTADGGEVFYQGSSVSGVNTGNFTLDSTTLVRSSYRNNMTDLAIFSTSGTATAEMLLKVGDYQDEQEILSGSITRNIRVLVLDGTEDWTQTTTSWGVYRYRFEPTGVPKKDGARGHCVSTHFFDIGGVTTQDIGGVFASTRFLYFIPDLTIDTVTKWTTYLADQYAAGTPVIVLYPLEEPTTESVAGQTLQVQDGDNTLEITQASLDNLELEASYQTLVQLTIQEVEDANLNNNVEVTIS